MDVEILAVPYDSARLEWRMGAGPGRLLDSGLVLYLEERGHKVRVTWIRSQREENPAEVFTGFELAGLLAVEVRKAVAAGRYPLVLSGNCTGAAGVLAGLTPRSRAVYWFDAHADCNTPETTVSGYLCGTALATAMGWCWRQMTASIPGFEPVSESDVRLVGVRDVDPLEKELMSRSEIRALDVAEKPNSEARYIHCDLDVLDPMEGRASPFLVPDGLTVEQVKATIQTIGPSSAATITGYAPEYDSDGSISRAAFAIIEAILG